MGKIQKQLFSTGDTAPEDGPSRKRWLARAKRNTVRTVTPQTVKPKSLHQKESPSAVTERSRYNISPVPVRTNNRKAKISKHRNEHLLHQGPGYFHE